MNDPMEIPLVNQIEEDVDQLLARNYQLRLIVITQQFALFIMTALILYLLSLQPGVQQVLKSL